MKHAKEGFKGLVGLFEQTQTTMQVQAARSVDIALVVRNWLFGWYIVEFENGGAERAELYGKKLFKRLSDELKQAGLKGMSQTNLRKFREFYQRYAEIQQELSVTSLSPEKIQQTLSAQSFSPATISEILSWQSNEEDFWQALSAKFSLSWSHYVVLLTIQSGDERNFYELESIENAWGGP